MVLPAQPIGSHIQSEKRTSLRNRVPQDRAKFEFEADEAHEIDHRNNHR
jgi:hypothetical protein